MTGEAILPPDCPLRPIGISATGALQFETKDLRRVEVRPAELNLQSGIDALFSNDVAWLWEHYARETDEGSRRIAYEDVRRDLIQACHAVRG